MFEGMTPPKKEALCLIARKAAELDKKDFDILQEALASPVWSNEALTLELTKRGFAVSKETLRVHRKGSCSCAR